MTDQDDDILLVVLDRLFSECVNWSLGDPHESPSGPLVGPAFIIVGPDGSMSGILLCRQHWEMNTDRWDGGTGWR